MNLLFMHDFHELEILHDALIILKYWFTNQMLIWYAKNHIY